MLVLMYDIRVLWISPLSSDRQKDLFELCSTWWNCPRVWSSFTRGRCSQLSSRLTLYLSRRFLFIFNALKHSPVTKINRIRSVGLC